MSLSYTPNALLYYEQVKNNAHSHTSQWIASQVFLIVNNKGVTMLTIQEINNKLVGVNQLKDRLEKVIKEVKMDSQALIDAIPKAQIPSQVYVGIKDAMDEALCQIDYAEDNLSSAESSIDDAMSEIGYARDNIEEALVKLEAYNDEVNKVEEITLEEALVKKTEEITDEQE